MTLWQIHLTSAQVRPQLVGWTLNVKLKIMAVFGMKIIQFREKVFFSENLAYSLFGENFNLENSICAIKDVIILLKFLLQEFFTHKIKICSRRLIFIFLYLLSWLGKIVAICNCFNITKHLYLLSQPCTCWRLYEKKRRLECPGTKGT